MEVSGSTVEPVIHSLFPKYKHQPLFQNPVRTENISGHQQVYRRFHPEVRLFHQQSLLDLFASGDVQVAYRLRKRCAAILAKKMFRSER